MSYEIQKSVLGHNPVYILEIDLRRCSNVIRDGVFPLTGFCTADPAIGLECFQTFPTCQDEENFDKANAQLDSIITYRFSSQRVDEAQQPGEPPTIPSLLSGPETTPTRLEKGKGLGIRSTVIVQLSDHPWNDIVTDPYRKTRPYVAEERGSFWGKLLNRNKFYEGSDARILTGYLDADNNFVANNFLTRFYLLNKITGPDYSGNITVELKDPLKKADPEKAQWPPQATALLNGDINSSVTTIPYTDPGSNLFDFLTANAGQRYIRVDDEIILVDSFTATDLTVTRASMPSFYTVATNIADSHSDDASIQMCYKFEDEVIQNVIFFLLNTPSKLDASLLPLTDWNATIDKNGYNSYLLSRLLTESDGVKKYLEQLTELNVAIWWDERDQEVDLGALTLSPTSITTYNEDDNIVDGSINVARDIKSRYSRVQIAYGIRNPTFDPKLVKNYQSVELKVDTDAESAFEYDQSRTRFIFSEWLTVAKRAIASEIASRLIIDNRDTKNIISLVLAPKDDAQWTGDVVKVNTRLIQDETGLNEIKNFQITEVNEQLDVDGVKYGYVLREAFSVLRAGVITPDISPELEIITDGGDELTDGGEEIGEGVPFPDYDVASEALKDQYAFIAFDEAPDPPGTSGVPGFNDDTDPYQIT